MLHYTFSQLSMSIKIFQPLNYSQDAIYSAEPFVYPLAVASFGENLGRIRREKGLTQDEVARRLGYVNQSQISAWERSKERLPAPETVARVAAAVGCTTADLLEGVETPYDRLRASPSRVCEQGAQYAPLRHDVDDEFLDVSGYRKDDIPVVAEGEACPQGELFWAGEGKLKSDVEDRISRPYDVRDPKAYGVRVRGDSMMPAYKPGMVLVVSPNVPVKSGDEVYVQLLNGERLLKVARKVPGGWMLESLNPAYEPRFVKRSEIGAMHPVLWARRKR